MRKFLILFVLMTIHNSTAQEPSMATWSDVWAKADTTGFRNLYAEEGIIFPACKSPVVGNDEILSFMRKGIGKVRVLFQPRHTINHTAMVFERGFFYDIDPTTGKRLSQGNYAVTWNKTENGWKLLSHAWSLPEKIPVN